jgi:hypothetical protein
VQRTMGNLAVGLLESPQGQDASHHSSATRSQRQGHGRAVIWSYPMAGAAEFCPGDSGPPEDDDSCAERDLASGKSRLKRETTLTVAWLAKRPQPGARKSAA